MNDSIDPSLNDMNKQIIQKWLEFIYTSIIFQISKNYKFIIHYSIKTLTCSSIINSSAGTAFSFRKNYQGLQNSFNFRKKKTSSNWHKEQRRVNQYGHNAFHHNCKIVAQADLFLHLVILICIFFSVVPQICYEFMFFIWHRSDGHSWRITLARGFWPDILGSWPYICTWTMGQFINSSLQKFNKYLLHTNNV